MVTQVTNWSYIFLSHVTQSHDIEKIIKDSETNDII